MQVKCYQKSTFSVVHECSHVGPKISAKGQTGPILAPPTFLHCAPAEEHTLITKESALVTAYTSTITAQNDTISSWLKAALHKSSFVPLKGSTRISRAWTVLKNPVACANCLNLKYTWTVQGNVHCCEKQKHRFRANILNVILTY